MAKTQEVWEIIDRVDSCVSASVLQNLSKRDWRYVITVPYGSLVFGQVVAAVCTPNRPDEKSLAIAHLIAAAPGLLAVCEKMLDYMPRNTDIYATAQEIIAKATCCEGQIEER
jgi:hypothetical protein